MSNDIDHDYLLQGLTEGFRIISRDSELRHVEATNYKLATEHDVRDTVEKTIREEIQQGNYIVTTEKPTIVSALGAIPKPDSDKVRLIHDCSRPQHSNVNSYTDTQHHYSYVTVDKAVSLIKSNAYKKLSLLSAILWRSFSTYIADRLLSQNQVRSQNQIPQNLGFESRENCTRVEIWERIVYIGYCDVKHNT